MKSNAIIPLQNVSVATPCGAAWENMQGDDTARFCQTCRKNVYNLSAMSRAEAESLIQQKEGRLCVRFYQREDGTMLTADCPVGLHEVRRGLGRSLAAGFAACCAFGFGLIGIGGQSAACGEWQPFKTVFNWIAPSPATPRNVIGMSKIAMPPAQPSAPALMGEMVVTVPPRATPGTPAPSATRPPQS